MAFFKLSTKTQYELRSALNTVVAAMILELSVQVFQHKELFDPTMITAQLLMAVGLSLVRAGWKAGLEFALSLLGIKTPKP